jgi:hypothetical protein
MRRYNSLTGMWEDDLYDNSLILIDPNMPPWMSPAAPFHTNPIYDPCSHTGNPFAPHNVDPFGHPCTPLGNPIGPDGNIL